MKIGHWAVDIIGHKKQWNLLLKLLEGDRMPHSFLFTGDKSLGKKKVALDFIKILNCKERFKSPSCLKPCSKCPPCSLIENKRHPDFMILEPQGKEIQIDQIRGLQKWLSFKAQLASFKIALIEDAETLNIPAQNCFLKTLEEPKGKTIFFLITAHPEMLLRTIRSRCEELRFYPVAFEEIQKSLEPKFSNSQIPLEDIIRASEGNPGRAISFLENHQKFLLELNEFEQISKFLSSDIEEKFSFVGDYFAKNIEHNSLNSFLDNFIRYLRIIFLQKLGFKNGLTALHCREDIEGYSVLKFKEIIEAVENLKFLLSSTNINQRLALENLILEISL